MLEAGGAAPVSNVVWTVADLFFISLILPSVKSHEKKKNILEETRQKAQQLTGDISSQFSVNTT